MKRGFTLIELVVTMAVLALLTLAATPSISDWLRNARLRNVTETVQNGLQQARNEAVRRNRQITFWLVNLPTPGTMDADCTLTNGGDANGWVISVDSPAGSCGAADSLTVSPMIVARGSLGQGGGAIGVTASNSGSGAAASSVTFDGLGRVVTSAANPAANLNRVVVAYSTASEGDRPLQLDLDASGGMRRCDQSIQDADDARACPGAGDPDEDVDDGGGDGGGDGAGAGDGTDQSANTGSGG